jgi:transglutaminase-like putative cysteine protease
MKRTLSIACGILAVGLLAGCSNMQSYDNTHFADGWSNPGVRKTSEHRDFDVRHQITITVPEGTKELRAWLAMPSDQDPFQRVQNWKVESPFPHRIERDSMGNNVLVVEATNPTAGNHIVTTTWHHHRDGVAAVTDPNKTRAHTPEELSALAVYLKDEIEAVVDDDIRAFAKDAVGNETNPVRASRLLYNAILEHVKYHVKDPNPDGPTKVLNATGTGNARKTFDTCTGNCTDFHSLYAAASRAVGIPARAVYGSFFKTPNDGVDRDQSYHCWIEFHAPNIGWIPLDVAVADMYVDDFTVNDHNRTRIMLTSSDGTYGGDPSLVDYHFGNLDARRVTWHWGRDLQLNPPQAGGPLPWLFGGHAETDGKRAAVARKLTFKSGGGH